MELRDPITFRTRIILVATVSIFVIILMNVNIYTKKEDTPPHPKETNTTKDKESVKDLFRAMGADHIVKAAETIESDIEKHVGNNREVIYGPIIDVADQKHMIIAKTMVSHEKTKTKVFASCGESCNTVRVNIINTITNENIYSHAGLAPSVLPPFIIDNAEYLIQISTPDCKYDICPLGTVFYR